MKERVMDELKRSFRPEFLNRIDEVIVFHSLTRENVKAIVDLMTTRVREQLKSKDLDIVLTDRAKEVLAEKGYDPSLGARALRRGGGIPAGAKTRRQRQAEQHSERHLRRQAGELQWPKEPPLPLPLSRDRPPELEGELGQENGGRQPEDEGAHRAVAPPQG